MHLASGREWTVGIHEEELGPNPGNPQLKNGVFEAILFKKIVKESTHQYSLLFS